MTQHEIRTATVGVSLSIVDRGLALATARAELVAAGEAALGPDVASLLREGDDLALLATLANPWRLVDGAEATSVALRAEDGDHVLEVGFAILDEAMVVASVAARLAALGRPARFADAVTGLRLLVSARLDRDGVEAQDSFVADGDDEDWIDAVLAQAAACGDEGMALAA